MKKKVFSIVLCLCMALSLLPTAARAATTGVTVGGVELNISTPYWKNGAASATSTEADYNAHFDAANETLTLHNANITGVDISNCKYGIYVNGNLTIKLEGDNTVSAGDSTNMNNFGIYVTDALTIRGDGSLSVSSGTVTGDTSSYYSDGIYTASGITIESGTITAMGGTTNGQSYGIESSGDISISGSSTVSAVGGSGDDACGIYVALANGALDISGSAHVTAVGGRADSSAASSHGIFVNNEGEVTIGGNAVVTAVGGSATNSASVTTASHGIRGGVTLSGNALLTAVGGDAGSWSYGVGGNFTYNGGVFAARGGYYNASFHKIESKPLRESPTLNNNPEVLGECNTTESYYVLEPTGGSSIYHVVVDNVTSADSEAGHITWNGNDCTLNNTVLVAADDQYNNNALTIPDGGDLTCEGVNVVLGIEAHGILIGGDADATIDGSGTLTAIGGVSFSSQNPGYGIMANGNLTLAGPGRIYAIGSNCGAHPGCAIGLATLDTISITGGGGMAVVASGLGSALDPNSSPNFSATGATLLGGAWDGNVAVWQAESVTPPPSSEKTITAFSIVGAVGTINEANRTIAVTVPYGADVTNLTPSITHTGASISPASSEAKDFTNSVTYTVTAADNSTKNYTVTVTVADPTPPTPSSPSAPSTPKPTDFPFTDVAEDAYCYDAVQWAMASGVTEGKNATTFAPYARCTRAQTLTFLWRAMGSPEPTSTDCPFTDVNPGAYYYKAMLWAVETGITKGTGGTAFSPNKTVSRGEVVTFQWRAAGSKTAAAANPFKDVAADAFCADAVLWAASEKITEGTTSVTFSPTKPCTRAQIVTFLFRQLGK